MIIKLPSVDNIVHADLICFCHLRWYFVYQRPQHLLSRFSRTGRVFFWEEPVFDTQTDFIETRKGSQNLWIITPHLSSSDPGYIIDAQKTLLSGLFEKMQITRFNAWYYSPLALQFSDDLEPEMVIYDCMDELSAFRFAPKELKQMESLLLDKADIVFTGGRSLYEAKQHLHQNIHCFPSSIDKTHFAKARTIAHDPVDQASIPHPRIGFYGVIDERFNTSLLQQLAVRKPDWHFIVLGPTAKIDPGKLPQAPNIHFPGPKNYEELPDYLAGWDVAMMPFALNESTKYISPTKTPEYLAGGKPVVSTSIRDVVAVYGAEKLVYIADTVNDFISAIQRALDNQNNKEWLRKVDLFLENNSWDRTYEEMLNLIIQTGKRKVNEGLPGRQAYV